MRRHLHARINYGDSGTWTVTVAGGLTRATRSGTFLLPTVFRATRAAVRASRVLR